MMTCNHVQAMTWPECSIGAQEQAPLPTGPCQPSCMMWSTPPWPFLTGEQTVLGKALTAE